MAGRSTPDCLRVQVYVLLLVDTLPEQSSVSYVYSVLTNGTEHKNTGFASAAGPRTLGALGLLVTNSYHAFGLGTYGRLFWFLRFETVKESIR
jgi:hypothetical protein